MLTYSLRRIGVGLITAIGVVTIVFFSMRAVRGDPAEIILSGGDSGSGTDPQALAALRHELGLDRPVIVQYVSYVFGIVRGNFGESVRSGSPVLQVIAKPIANTTTLVLLSTLIGAIVGIGLGVLAARYVGRITDRVASGAIMLGVSAPTYVGAVLLAIVFGVKLGWFPPSGYVPISDGLWPYLYRALLPSIALALTYLSMVGRMSRTSILETDQQDWVRTARGMGLSEGRVFRRYVFRNALNPIVTISGLRLGGLLGSTVLVEAIFNWPGLGTQLLRAVSERDYPLVQGIVLVLAGVFILVNLLTDLAYGLLDPRVRL